MLSPKSIKTLLNNVLLMAQELGIESGVAAIMIVNIHNVESVTDWLPLHGKLVRLPNLDKPNDHGTNYFGVAFSKIAEMISTGKNSGDNTQTPKKGELGFKGGITWQSGNFVYYLAFSGGTEEQDLRCVNYARVKTKV